MTLDSIGFIGGGRVSNFLLLRLNETGSLPERVIVSDPDDERRKVLLKIKPDKIGCAENNTAAAGLFLVPAAGAHAAVHRIWSGGVRGKKVLAGMLHGVVDTLLTSGLSEEEAPDLFPPIP